MKDFELIARVIENLYHYREGFVDGKGERQHLAHEFADALAETNPRFDRFRFIKACTGE